MAYLVTYQIFKTKLRTELRLCSFSIREIYKFYYENRRNQLKVRAVGKPKDSSSNLGLLFFIREEYMSYYEKGGNAL